MGNLPQGIGTGNQRSPAMVFSGRVTATNNVAMTVDIVDEFGGVYSGIGVSSQASGSSGGGSWYQPEVGTTLWLCRPSTQRTPIILTYENPPQGLTEDSDEDPNNYRNGKPVINDGDFATIGPGGSFMIVRKGGVVEVGASQVARRYYIPIRNVIRDICENYELVQAGGGNLTWETRRGDEHTPGKIPTEMRIQVNEFAGEAPIVDFRMGRIQEEDGESLVNGEVGATVLRLVVNNRFALYIDRDGNVNQAIHGEAFFSYNKSRRDYHHANFFNQVRGLFNSKLGSRKLTIGQDSQTVQGDRSTLIGGKEERYVEGSSTTRTGPSIHEVRGDDTQQVTGTRASAVTGSVNTTAGDDISNDAGGNLFEKAGKRKSVFVGNEDGVDESVTEVIVSGRRYTFNKAGEILISAGGRRGVESAKLRVTPDGEVVLAANGGNTKIDVNGTGVKISTRQGSFTIDASGSVAMGRGPAASMGRVLTTLSQPVDLVTGVPTLGSSNVYASGVSTPSTVPPIPLTFVDTGD